MTLEIFKYLDSKEEELKEAYKSCCKLGELILMRKYKLTFERSRDILDEYYKYKSREKKVKDKSCD